MRNSDVDNEIERMTNNRMGNKPVAWISKERSLLSWDKFYDDMQPLYTTSLQRPWVGLTEAQCGVLWKVDMTPFEYYQAIEAKLKEKNT